MYRSASLVVVFAAFSTTAGAEPSLERGQYLVDGPMGCGNCHTPLGPEEEDTGRALAGRVVEDNAAFRAVAPNITPAGEIADWSDAELIRAIREGIRPDGSLIGPPMPIPLYRQLSDDDVTSVAMYLRNVAPVENDAGKSEYHIPLPPAYGPPVGSVPPIPAGVTAEYGAYLAGPVAHCVECHTPHGPQGAMFDTQLGAGGMAFEGPGGTVIAPNITSSEDGLAGNSDDEIKAMITQGIRPDGSRMMPPMPYAHLAMFTPDDLDAVILYLRSLPALPDYEE